MGGVRWLLVASLIVGGWTPKLRSELVARVPPVRMAAAPGYVLRVCAASPLLAPVCPHRLPFVGPGRAWDAQLCRIGKHGCRGITFDALELQHTNVNPNAPAKPPAWAHVSLYAGTVGRVAFPFVYPTGKPERLENGLFARPRRRAIYFGHVDWGGKVGTLVLAPDFPAGGVQADHLIFRWRRRHVDTALGLHGWEPLSQVHATLKAMVDSIR